MTNGAELTRSALSRPILLDIVSPTAGDVKNGDNFNVHMTYQNAVAEMQGTILRKRVEFDEILKLFFLSWMDGTDNHWWITHYTDTK